MCIRDSEETYQPEKSIQLAKKCCRNSVRTPKSTALDELMTNAVMVTWGDGSKIVTINLRRLISPTVLLIEREKQTVWLLFPPDNC